MSRVLALLSLLFFGCKTTQVITPKQKIFLHEESTLITSGSDSVVMRILQLSDTKDSIILRSKSAPIKGDFTQDQELKQLINRMHITMTSALGVGIAAPQVGVLKQLICVQRFDKEGFPIEFYLNPNIRQYSVKTQPCQEGCLSIANKQGNSNKRAYAILVEYDTPQGEHLIEMVEDFTAVIFQHEIDHLEGILFIDHLEAESNSSN